jgi:transposase
MIVIGVDPHKQTHTAAALDSATGEIRDAKTAAARTHGYGELLRWARALDAERIWAVEDCRHVSGGLERFLIARGEQVRRVPPKLMAGVRRSARTRGKSDDVDAIAVARAALREPGLPAARLAGPERDIRLLLDHRENLVRENVRDQNRLLWHLHDIDPDFAVTAIVDHTTGLERIARRLRRREQTLQVEIARELALGIKARLARARALERQLTALVRAQAAPLLALPGCGVLTAAKLLGEIADVRRFGSDAQLAMHVGAAPLDASSGKQQRHRLNRSGNRQLNAALHRIAVTQGRCYPPAQRYLARRMAEGKTRKEAMRALKRHLARVVFRILTMIAKRLEMPERVEVTTAPFVPCLT